MKKLIIINISIISALFYLKLSNDNLNVSQHIYDLKSAFYSRRQTPFQESLESPEISESYLAAKTKESPQEAENIASSFPAPVEQTSQEAAQYETSENHIHSDTKIGELKALPEDALEDFNASLTGASNDLFSQTRTEEKSSYEETAIESTALENHSFSEKEPLQSHNIASDSEIHKTQESATSNLDSDLIAKIPEEEVSYLPLTPPIGTALAEQHVIGMFGSNKAVPGANVKPFKVKNPNDKEPNPYPLPKRIAISHNEGYGSRSNKLKTNYSLLELLLAPDARQKRFLTMIDLRGYRFDSGSYSISTGLVGRYVPSQTNFCELLGFNLYYDYQNTSCGYSNQLGAGAEVLGKRWDFRANFYAPFGHNQGFSYCNPSCVNGWFGFGYNAEVGYLAVRSKNFLLYTALGPYYITIHECYERQRGGMLRIVPQYKDYLALNMKLSYDSFFKTVFQAEFIVSLPLYQISVPEKGPCGITNRQIYQRVERRF